MTLIDVDAPDGKIPMTRAVTHGLVEPELKQPEVG